MRELDGAGVLHVVLASASPRRAELLRAAGIGFEVMSADVDEQVRPGEPAETYVRRLAEAKALAVSERAGDLPVVGADTAVVVNDVILGKPADAADARRMLRLLSGRTHEVLTGVAVVDSAANGGHAVRSAAARTAVTFAPMSEDDIDWYVASGEPMDKAGGYAIQGLASRFVTGITGSYTNVVGLPVSLLYAMLAEAAGRPRPLPSR